MFLEHRRSSFQVLTAHYVGKRRLFMNHPPLMHLFEFHLFWRRGWEDTERMALELCKNDKSRGVLGCIGFLETTPSPERET